MSKAVLDAGPLIHLSELDALDVLRDFEVLYIPSAVREEVNFHRPVALKKPSINLQNIIAPQPSIELNTFARIFSLDLGEIEALAFLETSPPELIFLTDDAAARVVASQRGIKVHGTIGLLIRSVRQGLRSSKEIIVLLESLRKKSTLFINPGLLQSIIQDVKKQWETHD